MPRNKLTILAKKIPKHQNYFITTKGDILSIIGGNMKKITPYQSNKEGYLAVTLSSKGKERRQQFYVHQLVAYTYLGKPKGREIDHIDRNRQNNNFENLQYISKADNLKKRKWGSNGLN